MRSLITELGSVLLASALTLPVAGQDATKPAPSDMDRATTHTSTADHTTNGDNGFSPGWLGLIGLIGLAGLMPRDRRDRHVHNVGPTTATR